MAKSNDRARRSSDTVTDDAVLAQLERILSSSVFIASPSLAHFLHFVVTETLAGRRDLIKAYTIAVKAWDRERDFDPQADPIVRIQAGRLRRALRDYYDGEGADDAIRVVLPKGTYVPRFDVAAMGGGQERRSAPAVLLENKEPSVAVLPLQNLSGDPAQGPLVDGFGEELAVQLSRFQVIAVIAYYSCRRFRDLDMDLREIGRQLGADFLVNGSFFRDDPLCRDAYSALANIHFQRGDLKGVIRACQRMLDINPSEAHGLGVAGFWLALAGDEERGLAYLDRAIALNPFYPGWFHLPYFLDHFVRGEYDQAYARAQGIHMPALFWDPLLRAVALSRMGHPGEAQKVLRELLQLKPDFAERYLSTLIIANDLRAQVLASLRDAGLPARS